MTKTIIIIGGPTASGKSGLALYIAKEMDAVIINADAMQIYSRIPILSAQPSDEDKNAAEHALYEVLSPNEHCSVGKWIVLAREAIDQAHSQGKTPIIVGGTGLYIRGLMVGMPAIPDIDESVRSNARQLHIQLGSAAFHAQLAARDPVMAERLHPSDSQRVIRAYEVIEQTGRSLSLWQQDLPKTFYAKEQFKPFVILPERQLLYRQCNGRFDSMIERGAIEEVAALDDVDPASPALKALGIRELRDYILGGIPLEEAITTAQMATRHYAKRQMTWFRNQMPDAQAIEFTDLEVAKNAMRSALL